MVICGLPRSFQENAVSVCRWVGAQEALGHEIRLVISVWNIMGCYNLCQGKKEYAKGNGYIDNAPLDDRLLLECYAGCTADICILDQDAMNPTFAKGVSQWEEWGITNRRGKAYIEGAFFSQLYTMQTAMQRVEANTDYIVRIRPDRDVSLLPNVDRLVEMTRGNAIALSRFRNIGSDQWFAGNATVMNKAFASCFDLLFDHAFVRSVIRQVEKPEMILIECVTTHMCNMCSARLEFSEGPSCCFNDIVTAKAKDEREARAKARAEEEIKKAKQRATQAKKQSAEEEIQKVKRQKRRLQRVKTMPRGVAPAPAHAPAPTPRAHHSFITVFRRSKHPTLHQHRTK